jgi:hypothetical protein
MIQSERKGAIAFIYDFESNPVVLYSTSSCPR